MELSTRVTNAMVAAVGKQLDGGNLCIYSGSTELAVLPLQGFQPPKQGMLIANELSPVEAIGSGTANRAELVSGQSKIGLTIGKDVELDKTKIVKGAIVTITSLTISGA